MSSTPRLLKITVRNTRKPLKSFVVKNALLSKFRRSRTLSDLSSERRYKEIRRSRENSPTSEFSRRVRFDKACKQHDGLRPASKAFDSVVWHYFMSSNYFLDPIESSRDFSQHFQGRDISFVSEVHDLLKDLIKRVTENLTSHVPVLSSGGGFGGRLTKEKHLWSLHRLEELMVEYVEHKVQNDGSSVSEMSGDSDEFASFEDVAIGDFEFLDDTCDFEFSN